MEGIVNFYENFLRNIERRFVIAQHAENIAGDRPLIAAHKLFKPVFPAADGVEDKFTVRKLSEI